MDTVRKYIPGVAVFAVILIAGYFLIGCQSKPEKQLTQAVEGAANAEFMVDGTLGGLGTFEWDTAPLITHAASALHQVGYAYKKHAITKDQGLALVAAIDKAHDTLVAAKAACKQVGSKCTGDESSARELLDQGRAQLEAISIP